jgi:threonine synthase
MRAKSYVTEMKCSRCRKQYDPLSGALRCDNRDEGRLDIFYDYEALNDVFNKEELSKRSKGVWKYHELLPINDQCNIVTLDEGGTPFVLAPNLGKRLGLRNLWLLDDTRKPTGSSRRN